MASPRTCRLFQNSKASPNLTDLQVSFRNATKYIQGLTDFHRETQVGPTAPGGVTSSSVEGIAVLLKSFQKMFSGYIVVWVQLVTLAGPIWNSGRVRYMNTDGFNKYLPGTYLGTQNS